MSKFAVLIVVAATCASGCRSLVQCRENESPLAPAILKEPIAINVTPEPDPAKTGCPIRNERESERVPFSPLVSDSIAQQVSRNPGGERGHEPVFDSWLTCQDFRSAWVTLAGNSQQPIAGDLWNIGCGTSHGPLSDDGWLGNKKVSVGISETPYNCLSDELKAVNAFVKVAQGEGRAWLVGWSYSGTGSQPYPVPRMQHIWHLSERIRVNAGVIFPNMVDPTFDISLIIRH